MVCAHHRAAHRRASGTCVPSPRCSDPRRALEIWDADVAGRAARQGRNAARNAGQSARRARVFQRLSDGSAILPHDLMNRSSSRPRAQDPDTRTRHVASGRVFRHRGEIEEEVDFAIIPNPRARPDTERNRLLVVGTALPAPSPSAVGGGQGKPQILHGNRPANPRRRGVARRCRPLALTLSLQRLAEAR